MSNAASLSVWAISAATIAAILLRPWRIGEWVWAVCGAGSIVAAGLLPARNALGAVADGSDVYLFLGGMVLLAELARANGVFDWLAGAVLRRNEGASAARLFTWVYGAGIAVTALLSNDGTILLLTPAAYAIATQAGIEPLPLLYACAFVANAASFLLPVSNPANLVVFRDLPALGAWIAAFGLPSLLALIATYAALRVCSRKQIGGTVAAAGKQPALHRPGKAAFWSVSVSALLIVAAAALHRPVGQAAALLGVLSAVIVSCFDRRMPGRVVREAPWSIVPLVAGLFIIVQALDRSGALRYVRNFLQYAGSLHGAAGNLLAGGATALADNILNNLPVGVFARYALHDGTSTTAHVAHAVLVGVDLGPNLSVTGSLATLLWLMILRRENVGVSAWQFLRLGVAVAVPALALSLLVLR